MKRFFPIILLFFAALLALSNCAKDAAVVPPPIEIPVSSISQSVYTPPPPPDTAPPSETPPPEPEPEPEVYDGPVSPLSGLPCTEEAVNRRPIAVMINNKREAQPQLGISFADIIYEVPVEGGITRMMAVFQDVTGAGVIGSVRSSRTYYLDLAQGHDAIYIHAGGSPQAYRAIADRKLTSLDGVNGSRQDIFYRDKERRKTMAYEHSLVTSSELILEYLPQYNFRLTHEEGYEYKMEFSDDAAPEHGEPAEAFDVFFSSSKKTAFSYNPEDRTYRMIQQGGPYLDGNSGQILTVTNVLVLRTQVGVISGDTEGRLNVKLTGSGEGFFFCGGKYIEISWSKKSETAQFVYTLQDGTPLILGRGQSYICIVPAGAELSIIGEN